MPVACTTHHRNMSRSLIMRLSMSLLIVVGLVTLGHQVYHNQAALVAGSKGLTGSPGLTRSKGMFDMQKFKVTDNKDPSVTTEHEIELRAIQKAKKKLEQELEHERKELDEKLERMKGEVKDAQREAEKAKKEMDRAVGVVQVDKVKYEATDSEEKFTKHVYSFRTKADDDGKRHWDASKNDLVILSSFTDQFGKERSYEDFLKMLQDIKDLNHPRVSLSFLVGDPKVFEKMDKHVDHVFNNIRASAEIKEVEDSFSKVTLIHAPFLEAKFKVSREDRHNEAIQRDRRRVLSQMRNFITTHGIDNERYSLFLDSDVVELPKDMIKNFIETDVDIATVRVSVKNKEGHITEDDYDYNAWTGTRKTPTTEEEQKMDTDPHYVYIPGDKNIVHMFDLFKNKKQYGLDDSFKAKYELRSVGGAVLWAKSTIYKQGAIFPPYYAIGTTWDRREGWDGIETEGLCYVANVMGYKCWGFPNMVAFHTY